MVSTFDPEPYLEKWYVQPCSYNKRDVLMYALGIGTSQDVVSFPSPVIFNGPIMAMPQLPGTKVILDGERHIEKFHEEKLVGVHQKGKGASVEQISEILDKYGKVYYRIISLSFFVGARGFKDSGKSYSEKVIIPRREPDYVEEIQTSKYQTNVYRLSGDYNPLHIDPNFALVSGFHTPIMHGLCSMGISVRAIMGRFSITSEIFKAVKVRFAAPVVPGQTLCVEMWKDGPRVIFLSKVKETGVIVINNSYVDLNMKSKM
eukprot:GSMAST32.ASY1.ANO1.1568.1 assembled CDS